MKPDDSVAPNVYNLAAVLDLNGDGKLEVMVHSFYYEVGQTTIYRWQPDKIEAVLSVECGARESRWHANLLGEIRASFY